MERSPSDSGMLLYITDGPFAIASREVLGYFLRDPRMRMRRVRGEGIFNCCGTAGSRFFQYFVGLFCCCMDSRTSVRVG